MERTRYTIAEARAALGGIDAKTILDWCEKAEPPIVPTVDKRDQRRKFISADDLARLAADHEREIVLDDVPRTLADALKVIARQAALVAELRRQVDALESAQSTRTARIALERARAPITDQTTWGASDYTASPPRTRRRPSPVAPMAQPEGLTLGNEMIRRHGIPRSTIEGAIDRGDIPVTKGAWKVERNFVLTAFDADQHAAFFRHFHARPDFTRCPDCPTE